MMTRSFAGLPTKCWTGHGPDALRFALNEAELAEGFDDIKAAATWENIARAIRKITRP